MAEEPSPEAEREEVVVAEEPSVGGKRMRKRKYEGLDRKRHEIRHDFISDCILHFSVLYASSLIILNPNRNKYVYMCTALW